MVGMFTTDVLVVGAGPAGLATAVSALRHGARVLVVERRAGTSTVPRATGISIRTMELFRFWGVADAVRAGSIDCDPTVAVADTLAAEPARDRSVGLPALRESLAASPAYARAVPAGPHRAGAGRRGASAGRAGPVRHRARRNCGPHRTGCGPCSDRPGGSGPGSWSAPTARAARCAPRWASARSARQLGEFELALFRPDLAARRTPERTPDVRQAPDAGGVLPPVGDGRWGFVRERGRARPACRRIGGPRCCGPPPGFADLRPEILGRRRSRWRGRRERLPRRAGLPGRRRRAPDDPVRRNRDEHRDPRRPRARLAAGLGRARAGRRRAAGQLRRRARAGGTGERRARASATSATPTTGCPATSAARYRSTVIADDGRLAAVGHHRSARPGERAPHVWVRSRPSRQSTLDLFEDRLTVLAGSAGAGWDRALSAARSPGSRCGAAGGPRRCPTPAVRCGAPTGSTPTRAVLVRPDGVVVWRHDGPCRNHAAALAAAVGTALGPPCRPPSPSDGGREELDVASTAVAIRPGG